MSLVGRIVARLDKWAAPKPRCEYRAPMLHEQCIYDQGHGGACCTQIVHTNKRTGRRSVTPQWWYGVNYE